MLLQEHCFSGRELHFKVTMQFITLREKRIVEEINGEEKKSKIKDYVCISRFLIQNCEIA